MFLRRSHRECRIKSKSGLLKVSEWLQLRLESVSLFMCVMVVEGLKLA